MKTKNLLISIILFGCIQSGPAVADGDAGEVSLEERFQRARLSGQELSRRDLRKESGLFRKNKKRQGNRQLEEKKLYKMLKELKTEKRHLEARLALEPAIEGATVIPSSKSQKGSITEYAYRPDKIFEVYTTIGQETEIAFQESEQPIDFGGDKIQFAHRWMTSGDGNRKRAHLLIRPKALGVSSHFFITTDKRVYRLHVISSDTFSPSVRFSYPLEEQYEENAQHKHVPQIDVGSIQKVPDKEKFSFSFDGAECNYRIKGDEDISFRPVMVCNDGEFTLILMRADLRVLESPAIYALSKDGDPELQVDFFRIRDRQGGFSRGSNHFAARGVFEELELRLGNEVVRVVQQGRDASFWDKVF